MRRTKKIVILEDIIKKISSGQFCENSEFPCTRQLAQQYNISIRTASAVMQELARQGLIDTSPGRRSIVNFPDNIRLNRKFFTKPVAIIIPPAEVLDVVSWRSWLLTDIQNRLQKEKIAFSLLSEEDCDEGFTTDFSAVVVAGELIHSSLWEHILNSNIPCVRLSFFRPHPNTVFIDYRSALDHMALYLGAQECKRIIQLASCEREAKYAFNWFSDIGVLKTLQDYNVEENGFLRLPLSSTKTFDIKRIYDLAASSDVKTAYLISHPGYIDYIYEAISKLPGHLGASYEVISLSAAPEEKFFGHCIDMNCSTVVDKMLQILSKHARNHTTQFGEIVPAVFV